MTPNEPTPSQPWRLLAYLWVAGTSRFTLFCLALLFFWLWRTHPVYTPDEAVRIAKERLRVAQQIEEMERERLAILGRIVELSGGMLREQFSPADYVKPTNNASAVQ